eukprot:TRINITY_DN5133_c0_g1_i1.p2 TRINITY_DN5133_c0_g1~~TRINITY_DN5133_c0_g1_i1.p2  ORF type:complete len:117 (-),score=9.08 TRINITY_DN5133_c0_g1_i1:70-420(-)
MSRLTVYVVVVGVVEFVLFFFFKQKTAYEIMPSLVGSEMCIRDSPSISIDSITSSVANLSLTCKGTQLVYTIYSICVSQNLLLYFYLYFSEKPADESAGSILLVVMGRIELPTYGL